MYKNFTLDELEQQSVVYHRGFYIATKMGHEGLVKKIDDKIQAVNAELVRRAKDMDEDKIWKKGEAPEHIKDEFARQCYEAGRKRIKLVSIGDEEV